MFQLKNESRSTVIVSVWLKSYNNEALTMSATKKLNAVSAKKQTEPNSFPS
jgi:hypothetical protein